VVFPYFLHITKEKPDVAMDATSGQFYLEPKLEFFAELAGRARDKDSAGDSPFAVLHPFYDTRGLAALGAVGALGRVHYFFAICSFCNLCHVSLLILFPADAYPL
jgi:hypothetical protein